jgi:hypothetical protein
MTDRTVSRRAFALGGAAAATAAVAGAVTLARDGDGGGGGLVLRGVDYDTERTVWEPAFVRREVAAIRHDLHANAVLLLGSDLDRLVESATAAAEEGLHVWFEPRRFDADAADTLAFVLEVARAAEALRAEHPDVGLSLGVELTIFMDGLVPGADWAERGAALGVAPAEEWNGGLNRFLADALAAVRPVFGGTVTYSSGPWEDVDWSGIDVLGIDLYRDADNAATYAEDVRRLHRHGKPVVVTEFGCCSYRGAEDRGGMGFDVVDWEADPPVIAEGTVRDEHVQARYLEELLDVFEAEGVHGAFVYDFIEPDNPRSPDPRYDYDMAGFAITTCYPSGSERAYDRTGHFDRKVAFDALARRYA